MLSEEDLKIQRIVFTSDLLKVDDRKLDRFANPQSINIDWIRALFGPLLRDFFPDAPQTSISGDDSNYQSCRWLAFSALGLPLDSRSWAYLYEGLGEENELLGQIFDRFFTDDLLVTFEAPPYLLQYCEARRLPFIDFAIHPIRFLPDYLFGIRTNVRTWSDRLASLELPDAAVTEFARISAARTARVLRGKLPTEGSALFLGQIEIDSSLIANRRLATTDDVQSALLELTTLHPHVYYKAHPHLSDKDAVRKLVEGIKGCSWIEINVYDALACDRFATTASLSSGTLVEAEYFGRTSRPMLPRRNYFARDTEPGLRYVPIYEAPFGSAFWRYLISAQGNPAEVRRDPRAGEGALKFTLNMKWGR